MKKVFITLLLASFSLASFAQVKNERPKHDRKNPKSELNLTEEQKQQMKELRENFQAKRKQLFQDQQTAMKQILTPEQQSKWEEMQKNRSNFAKEDKFNKNREGKHHPRRHKNFSHHGKRDHGKMLDEATRSKLNDLRAQFNKEKDAIKNNPSSIEQQKKQMDELKNKFRSERQTIIKEAKEKTANEKKS